MGQLLGGSRSWDAFVSLVRSPYFLTLDVVLIAGTLIHGLNGLRVALLGFGVGLKARKALIGMLLFVAVTVLFVVTLLIYGG